MQYSFIGRFTALAIIAGALIGVAKASAGDLVPAPGPVVPTMKTLDEVEPRIPIGPLTTPGNANAVYRITSPGSYYLTENLLGEVGKHGIEVFTGGDIWIDLNGMTLKGVAGSLNGINSLARTSVVDGFVTSWGGDGVNIGGGIIQNVAVVFNGRDGIRALWGSVVSRCFAESNGRDGISLSDISRIEYCISKVNGRWGLHTDGIVTIEGCTIAKNTGGGIDVNLAHVTDCMFFTNSVAAIIDHGNSTIRNNTIHSSPVGIQVLGNASRIESNHVSQCNTGIETLGIDTIVISNTVRGSITPYNILAGNQAGAIVSSPVGAGPWDNFQ